jgi:hypothetical protein
VEEVTDGDEPMDETLKRAIDVLGQLQFETGGSILDHVVALKAELVAERQRRLENLTRIAMSTDMLHKQRGEMMPCSHKR